MPDLFLMESATNLGNSLLRSIILLYFYLSTQGQHTTLTCPRAETAAVWFQAWPLLYGRYISCIVKAPRTGLSHLQEESTQGESAVADEKLLYS